MSERETETKYTVHGTDRSDVYNNEPVSNQSMLQYSGDDYVTLGEVAILFQLQLTLVFGFSTQRNVQHYSTVSSAVHSAYMFIAHLLYKLPFVKLYI